MDSCWICDSANVLDACFLIDRQNGMTSLRSIALLLQFLRFGRLAWLLSICTWTLVCSSMCLGNISLYRFLTVVRVTGIALCCLGMLGGVLKCTVLRLMRKHGLYSGLWPTASMPKVRFLPWRLQLTLKLSCLWKFLILIVQMGLRAWLIDMTIELLLCWKVRLAMMMLVWVSMD